MTDNITRETLLELKKGDHKAFEHVFLFYFNRVKVFIERIVRSEAEAEELAQEVFVRLWNQHDKIECERSIHSLLFTISHNLAVNYLRHKLVEDDYLSNISQEFTEENVEDQLYAKEIALLIEMAVNEMPEQRKRIFNLSRQEGLTNTEIAERLSISKKTVENQLSLALKDLRKIVTLFLLFMS